ncbi:COX assembly mitochondrial protein homolog [Actinia tenebrosa]|uniref:COX assembly mitochondrial protein n=1 Tax=Actinia tenebrosa TaxID=6105 RepID=A0A6P8I1D8_ACTTE|nr:COX assembly mitochondrial protein homolog [Actinia tenebrosa]
MADDRIGSSESSSDVEKEVPPWAKGETLRHVERDVLIPKIVREISREKCKPYLDEFTNCCKGRTLSMVWACRKENRVMQDCLQKYFKDNSIYEEAKHLYLQRRDEFQKDYAQHGEKTEFKKKESVTF